MVHCPLWMVHCPLWMVHCIWYTAHYGWYTVYGTLYMVHCSLWMVHCIWYTVYGTLSTMDGTLYMVHCPLWMVHSTVHSTSWQPVVPSALYSVSNTQFIQFTRRWILLIVNVKSQNRQWIALAIGSFIFRHGDSEFWCGTCSARLRYCAQQVFFIFQFPVVLSSTLLWPPLTP